VKESLVKEPTPAPPKAAKPAEEPSTATPFSLSAKLPAGTPLSVGMPKSKKPWKALSERSSKHTPYNPRNWEQKMAEKKKLKAVRDRVKEERERKKAARRQVAERLREKARLKEVNTMKSASYQIVSCLSSLTLL
jgi:Cgr1 family